MNRRGVHLKLEKLEQFQSSPFPVKSPFVLLLVCDVTAISAEVLGEFAETALKRGMVYFCAWGPDCERVHDVVDEVVVTGEYEPDDKCIMTTWHAKETLEEVVNYATGETTDSKDERGLIVVTVANQDWAATVDRMLVISK